MFTLRSKSGDALAERDSHDGIGEQELQAVVERAHDSHRHGERAHGNRIGRFLEQREQVGVVRYEPQVEHALAIVR